MLLQSRPDDMRARSQSRRPIASQHRASAAVSSRRGQALALASMFLVVLVALLGIGVDGGSLYLQRRAMQVAADAAALAGARIMGAGDNSGADIRAQIDRYAAANLVDQPSQNVSAYYTDNMCERIGPVGSGSAPASAVGVEVVTTKQAPTFFLPVLGINALRVSALAAAHARPGPGGGLGYVIFALAANLPPGNKVIDWSGGGWTVTGTVHSNSDVDMSGGHNIVNGTVEDVTGAKPTGLVNKATLTPSTNNPVQSTVLPDPVNKKLADFYQGTTSTATYHYISGSTNLSSYVVNGVLLPGVYYVNGNINFAKSLSLTVPSVVTLVATGSIIVSCPTMNFEPYSQGMLFFANVSSNNTGLNISGSNGSWNGIAYAPHSNLRASGSSNLSANGSLVGNTVTLTGGGAQLAYNGAYSPQSMAEIILYK